VTAVWIGVGLLAFGAVVYGVCGTVCVAVGRGRRDEEDSGPPRLPATAEEEWAEVLAEVRDTSWGYKIKNEEQR